ncbi:sensor histidine kinase [Brevibacillus brevis]|uniref:sensor histidine kinase n=1 Tax=Brevibacillus brevis TaxID=1393 RepID=UPI001EDB7749|nr:ATP-binding protein [Brevibacillus brevis]UKL00977.1 GHKL domain-containing protein [Brevibacillus brevis]
MKLRAKDFVRILFDLLLGLMIIYAVFQMADFFANNYLYTIPEIREFIWKMRVNFDINSFKIPIILLATGMFAAWSVVRIRKYLEQKQMEQIISELHFIAKGNYHHQISIRPNGSLGQVVDSIHALVKSALDAMEEERRLEQSKDELITNVSHDLRTPLTSIIGYLGLIEQNKQKDEEKLKHYAHIAYEKAKQMNVLVNDLFEYTKVRNRGAYLKRTQFDLVELVEQVSVGFRLVANEAGLRLIVDTPDQKIEMAGDTDKLVRVLENLISNAVKYGHDGTEIIIRVFQQEEGVAISVANNGAPIPAEYVSSLFERFFRVEGSRSKETGGSGLGLAIAKSIIDLHQGTISVESTNEWTTFTVWLPRTISSI